VGFYDCSLSGFYLVSDSLFSMGNVSGVNDIKMLEMLFIVGKPRRVRPEMA
jgi:hypothetical protein